MELPEVTINGLQLLQNSSLVNDEIFHQLLETVASDIVSNKPDGKKFAEFCDANKPEVTKAAYADLSSLFVEAGRNKFDAEKLSIYLQTIEIFGNRAEKLVEVYEQHKDGLIDNLNSIGDCLPCIVDVDWRIDYCVKSNTCNNIGECLYHVRLSTKKHGKVDYVKFSCTILQMQELVYKLRDAVRHMEKISSTS